MMKKISLLFLTAAIGVTTYAQTPAQSATAERPASFLDMAQTRYTTKVYDLTKKVSDEQIAQLAEILRLTPSSINSQPWQFVIVSDEATKNRLAEVSTGSNRPRVQQASHIVVFRGFKNLEALEQQMKEHLPAPTLGYYTNTMKPDEAKTRAWIANQVYIALGFFLAAVGDMNIDSTPMEGIFPAEYDKVLNMGDDYQTYFAVAIGYRDPVDGNQPTKRPKSRLPQDAVVKFIN